MFYFVLLIINTLEISPYIFQCNRKNLTVNRVTMYHVYVLYPQRITCVFRKVEYPHDVFKSLVLTANRRREMGRSAIMTLIPTVTSVTHVTFFRTDMDRKFH